MLPQWQVQKQGRKQGWGQEGRVDGMDLDPVYLSLSIVSHYKPEKNIKHFTEISMEM